MMSDQYTSATFEAIIQSTYFLWIAVRDKVGDPNANRDWGVFLSSLEQPRPLNSDDDEFCALLFHL